MKKIKSIISTVLIAVRSGGSMLIIRGIPFELAAGSPMRSGTGFGKIRAV